jgi:ubiquinone biosynthesis protein COQ4
MRAKGEVMLGYSNVGISTPNVRQALRSLRALLRDPNDTAEGFRVIEALDPRIYHRTLSRIASRPSGLRLLREQPVLLDALRARDALDALPEGSLGRAYREFCTREGLNPDTFVQIGEAGSLLPIDDPLLRFASHRSRDSHDVWHVVSGFRTDMAGEAGILGFTFAQTRSPGLLLLFIGGLLHSFTVGGEPGQTMRRMAWFGLRSGTRAEPLAAAPWEEWLSKPIADVRAELRITELPEYAPVYSEPAPQERQESTNSAAHISTSAARRLELRVAGGAPAPLSTAG